MPHHHTHAESVWSDPANVEYLKAHASTDTAADIAAVIGNGVTKNGVIGKAHRLGLAMRPRPGAQGRKTRNRKLVSEAPIVGAVEPTEMPTPSIDDATIPRTQLKSLVELENGDCRWPVDNSDGGFLFCGDEAVEGFSYCFGHLKRALVPIHRPLNSWIPPRTGK